MKCIRVCILGGMACVVWRTEQGHLLQQCLLVRLNEKWTLRR